MVIVLIINICVVIFLFNIDTTSICEGSVWMILHMPYIIIAILLQFIFFLATYGSFVPFTEEFRCHQSNCSLLPLDDIPYKKEGSDDPETISLQALPQW